jgi:UDP-4-amino-4,6-dideoxy-N-acetyl-beta-L-altrosamine transaminase
VIPYGRQEITQNDIDAVTQVLQSDFLTQGPVVSKFEKIVANYCSAKYGVATNSATSALHISCLALGLKAGDYLWTSPITFVASANCGLYCGAKVDFVDIDEKTYNLSVVELEKKLIQAKKANKLPKIIIPVHFAGQSCEMDKIYQLSQKFGFKIIEDASHATGAKYRDKPVGNCEYSDITIFSFHPVKIITTGEGGMAVTNSQKLSEKMLLLRSHGITREPDLMTNEPDGDWYYQQIELGYNYRMTDIQAALGISQIKRLDKYIEKRHNIATRYNDAFKKISLSTPFQNKSNYSSYHLYVILLQNKTSKHHKEIFTDLRMCGIGVNLHYMPVYRQPYYRNMGFEIGVFPNAEKYYQQAISLPIFPTLSVDDQTKVIESVEDIIAS